MEFRAANRVNGCGNDLNKAFGFGPFEYRNVDFNAADIYQALRTQPRVVVQGTICNIGFHELGNLVIVLKNI